MFEHVGVGAQRGHWVGGRLVDGESGRTSPIFDPATGVQVAEVSLASSAEVDNAVQVARTATEEWGSSSLATRSDRLFRWREILHAESDVLAAVITREHGKVLDDARGEVARGLENVEFACGVPNLLKGASNSEVSSGVDVRTVLEPLGVVVGVTPFNFPAMVPLWMVANAVACGNCVVLKPSEKDPTAALILAETASRAGFPDGVVNVVQGDGAAVEALVTHPDVAAVSFVGSTSVARFVYETAARHGKRVQALGGAKNHMVVLPDADIGLASDAAVSAAYGSAGERCMAVSVVVAVGAVADQLVDAIASRIRDVVVGPGSEPGSMMGPLITAEHQRRVQAYVEEAVHEGATVVADGSDRPDGPGFFVGCALLDHVKPGMAVYDDEIFGPVLNVVRVPTFDEALALVNDNPYGNGAAVFTRDGAIARRFERGVSAGMVGVNVPVPVPAAAHSFGGWKSSMFGGFPIYGPEGVRFYTRPKVVTSRWPESGPEGMDLHFPTNR